MFDLFFIKVLVVIFLSYVYWVSQCAFKNRRADCSVLRGAVVSPLSKRSSASLDQAREFSCSFLEFPNF